MESLDLVIRNGTVVSASDTMACDVGVRDGRVVALAQDLPRGKREIDASGRLVLPGGIDSHCHIEQHSSFGVMCADDFRSGTISAAFGGTTTIIPFAAQHRGQSLREVVEDYHARATPKAVTDYAFHLIISDPTEQVLGQELPALIRDGYTSFKVYMTYELLRLDDYQMLDVLDVARREQAMVMVHAGEPRRHPLVQPAPARPRTPPAALPRGEPPPHRGGRGDGPGHQPGRADRRAVADRARLGRGGDRRYPRRAPPGAPDLRRDLSPVSLPHREGPRPGRHGGGEVLLQPAAPGRGGPGSGVAGTRGRQLRGLLLRSCAVPLRRERQARQGSERCLQGHRQRGAGDRAAPAPPLLRRRGAEDASISTASSR